MEQMQNVLKALLKDIGDTAEEMINLSKDEKDCNKALIPLFEVQSELLDNKYELIKNGGKK